MSIWFCIVLILLCILLIIKIFLTKKEIRNIGSSLSIILKSDTNNLITTETNDKDLKKLANILNESLKELRTLELEYKQGNRELKESITNISHDLRTPLTAIRGYLDLINRENINEKYLEIIDNKVKDIIELTEQLFDFSKSVDMYSEIKKEKICVNDILEDSIISFYSVFKKNNIQPNIRLCDEKINRFADENTLKRIFENIISNAIKYSQGDFNVRLYNTGIIEFSNKTDMIDTTSLEKIFDRYYTISNAKKSNGIGLSIAKQLVDLNGGKIEAKYRKGNLVIKIEL